MTTYKRTISLNGEVELRSEIVETRTPLTARRKHLRAIKVQNDHIAEYADVALRCGPKDFLEIRYAEVKA